MHFELGCNTKLYRGWPAVAVKRYEMLCRRLSSWDWSGFVVLRGLETFADTFIVSWGVLDDFGHGQNLDLCDRVWAVLDVTCHEFCTGFLFSAWHIYGFHTRGKPLWSVLQLGVKSFACLGSWTWVDFCKLTQVCITLFFLRHRNEVDCTLPVKMCGTHLGVILSVVCMEYESSIKVWGTHLRMW